MNTFKKLSKQMKKEKKKTIKSRKKAILKIIDSHIAELESQLEVFKHPDMQEDIKKEIEGFKEIRQEIEKLEVK